MPAPTTLAAIAPAAGMVAALVSVLLAGVALPARADTVFPGATWAIRTPAEAGMDPAKLDQIAAAIGGNGCIVRDGYMIRTWGSQSAKGDWASASKPVLSTLLFFAIEEGRVGSVDSLIRDQGWPLNAKDQPMTFRHLANMTGNYTRGEAPGAAWAYNDYNIQLYVRTLFDRVYGQSANTVALAPTRLGALQLQDGTLFGGNNRLNTSVRDFARIGWLWANKGHWNGTQLLPQHYFDDYMKPHVPASLPKTTTLDPAGEYLGIGTYGGGSDQTPYGPGIYGFNWWFNAIGGLHPTSLAWPDAPLDTVQANGHWGAEVVTVIPSLRIVLAHFQGATLSFQPGNPNSSMNQVLGLLAESVSPETPLIAINPAAFTRTIHLGESLATDLFTVSNGGIGTLVYSINIDQSWLNVDPTFGTAEGETDQVTIAYDVAGLPVGTHDATITVRDGGSTPPAANTPRVIAVTVHVTTVRPDLDLDGDVDQADFGTFQRCLSDPGLPGLPPACSPCDFNGDTLVSQTDLPFFLECYSGPHTPAEKACDDAVE